MRTEGHGARLRRRLDPGQTQKRARIGRLDGELHVQRWRIAQTFELAHDRDGCSRHIGDCGLAQLERAVLQRAVETQAPDRDTANGQGPGLQFENGVEAVQPGQGVEALAQAHGAAQVIIVVRLRRQVGVEVELVEGKSDAKTGPVAQGNGDAAAHARDVDLHVDVGDGHLAGRRVDGRLSDQLAQAPPGHARNVHVEPQQHATEIVRRGFDLALEHGFAVTC